MNIDGLSFVSCAHWLAWRIGLALGAAREHVRVARALGSLPRLREALARGELSYSKIRALTRVATPDTEERLLAVGRAGTAEHVEVIVRGWRRIDCKAEVEGATRRHRHRDAQVLADADAPGQSVLDGGARVPAGTSQRLACDASRVVMRHGADGRITEVGARTRTIPPALRRALQHRDKGCRFPGCGLRFAQVITSGTGHMAARQCCRISRCCVGDTIARSTKRAIRSSEVRPASSASGCRMAERYPMSQPYPQCQRM
jgi:hypothetical protein